MIAVPADLSINARWILPMTRREEILEHHTLVMRDGRILDLLPSAAAAASYAPEMIVERPAHLLLPGLVNARTVIGKPPGAAPLAPFWPEGALLCMANMLRAGITGFCDVGSFPRLAAQMAAEQGVRVLIGLPVAERPGPWAENAAECLTHALELRDEYKAHPFVHTGFALGHPTEMSDETLARIGMLADEIDAGILISLHERQNEIEGCLTRHGVRPLARLQSLGLLTPALCAAHMAYLTDADIELARGGGIGITLCLESDLARGSGLAPIAPLAAAGLRLSLGTDRAVRGNDQELWTEIKLLTLHSWGAEAAAPHAAEPTVSPWDALAAATRGGASVLGLEADIGTLEAGKWADLCCIDLGGPATQPILDPIRQLVFSAGRDMVSDVWVAGRQLLCGGELTRLDWPALAERHGAPARRPA